MNKVFFACNVLIFAILMASLVLHADREADALRSVQEISALDSKQIQCRPYGRERWLIEFPEHMVAATELDQEVDPSLVQITPELPRVLRWLSSTQLICELRAERKAAQPYRLSLQSGLTSVAGAPLIFEQQFDLSGSVPRVLVCKSSVEENKLGVYLQFNMDIDLNQIQKFISVADEAETQQVFSVQIIDQRALRLDFQTEFLQPRQYRVCIHPGLSSPLGPLRLTEPQYFDVAIGTPLICTEYSGNYESIRLDFNQQCAQVDERFVQVEGATDISIRHRYGNLYLYGTFNPGQSYRVKLLQGFPGNGQLRLPEDREYVVTIKPREAELSFVSQGLVLSQQALPQLELKGVNCEEAKIEIRQVYQQNFVFLCQNHERLPHGMYGPCLKKSFPMPALPNQDFKAHIDLASMFKEQPRGLYEVRLLHGEYYWQQETRLVHITDVGIYTRFSANQAMVACQSIATGEALAQAKITILSKENTVLGRGLSDEQGLALIELKSTDANESVFVVSAEIEGDLAFIDAQRFDTGVLPGAQAGRPYLALLPGHLAQEAYINLDRGIIRPGGKVHTLINVRDLHRLACAHELIQAQILNAQGKIIIEESLTLNQVGLVTWEPVLPRSQKSGTWQMRVLNKQDQNIGTRSFLVEDFEPEKLHALVSSEDWISGTTNTCSVAVHWLEGGAAAGLEAKLYCRLDLDNERPELWSGFNFSGTEVEAPGALTEVQAKTDAAGIARFSMPLPKVGDGVQQMRAQLLVEVTEPSGRAVRALKTIAVMPSSQRLGIRCQQGQAEVCLLQQDWTLNQGVEEIELSIEETNWNYSYRQNQWQWNQEHILIHRQKVSVSAGKMLYDCGPYLKSHAWYKISAKTLGTDVVLASCYNGQHANAQKPNQLSLEGPSLFSLGMESTCIVTVPQPGPAIISLEGVHCYQLQRQYLEQGRNEIRVAIPEAVYEPNLQLVVSQQLSQAQHHDQQHWFLGAMCSVPMQGSSPSVEIRHSVPENVKPMTILPVQIHAPGCRYAYVSLVDRGILQITNHPVPNPMSYFAASRRSSMYGLSSFMRLMQGARYASQPGGDGRLDSDPMISNYIDTSDEADTEMVALVSPIIELDFEGRATYQFEIPDYEGTLRLDIHAIGNALIEAVSTDLRVADDFGLRIAAPRALRPGDLAQIPITIANRTSLDQQLQLEIQHNGQVSAQPLQLASGERKNMMLAVRAEAAGDYPIQARLFRNGETLRVQEKHLKIEHAAAYSRIRLPLAIAEIKEIDLSAWQKVSSLKVTMYRDLFAMNREALNDLIQYPYGCLEQTTSRCMALLSYRAYVKQSPDSAFDQWQLDVVDDYIRAGIMRLQEMRIPRGGMSWWPNGHGGAFDYGSLYVYHFLIEAAAAGFRIPTSFIEHVQSYARELLSESKSASLQCYALSLLAQNKQAVRHFLPTVMTKNLSRESILHLLAVANGYQDQQAVRALQLRLDDPQNERGLSANQPEHNAVLYSTLRSAAVEARVRYALNPDDPQIQAVQLFLFQEMSQRWQHLHTNEKAAVIWGLSINKPSALNADQHKQHQLSIGFGDVRESLVLADGAEMSINPVAGADKLHFGLKTPAYAMLEIEGLRIQAESPMAQRIQLQRHLIDVRTNQVVTEMQQGQTYRVDLDMNAAEPMQDFAITDMLPAGCELVSQRYEAARSTRDFKTSAHQEQRGNKIFIFPNPNARTCKTHYFVRAVFRGAFTCPPMFVESMYHPEQNLSIQYATTLQIH